jgi:hypothetical protein
VILDEFRRAFPEGAVLAAPSIEGIRHNINPYLGYDAPSARPVFFAAQLDDRLPAMQRVALIDVGSHRVVVPFPAAPAAGEPLCRAFPMTIDGTPIVLFFDARARSPLDFWDIGTSRQVGVITAYRAQDGESTLSFDDQGRAEASFVDGPTQAVFDVFGRRKDDPAAAPLVAIDVVQGFWFSVAAAFPGVEVLTLDAG